MINFSPRWSFVFSVFLRFFIYFVSLRAYLFWEKSCFALFVVFPQHLVALICYFSTASDCVGLLLMYEALFIYFSCCIITSHPLDIFSFAFVLSNLLDWVVNSFPFCAMIQVCFGYVFEVIKKSFISAGSFYWQTINLIALFPSQ